MFLVQAAFYFVLSLMVYTVAFYALRESVLARMNPWIGTAILLTPVLVVLMFDLGPPAFQIGINAYVGTSLIVASFMRYGGCEVVAVPSLLFGKRYVVYCPYNVIDVVEKAVVDRHRASGAKGDRQAWLAAGVSGVSRRRLPDQRPGRPGLCRPLRLPQRDGQLELRRHLGRCAGRPVRVRLRLAVVGRRRLRQLAVFEKRA
jgi:hypothetical protein